MPQSLFKFIFIVALFATAIGVAIAAQEAASIGGIVTDQNGAAVANAQITAININIREEKRTFTDTEGRYTFGGLPLGVYTVSASAKGFANAIKEVRVNGSASDNSTDFQLSVGGVGETVTIEEETARVDIERTPGGVALVPQKQIQQSLAYNLKDVFSFTPGVLAQPRYGSDEAQFSIRGSGLRNNYHARGVNILINGLPYQDADGFSDYESLDFLVAQRVEVWKGANALRYGGNTSGGAINLVTQTGESTAPFEFRMQGGSFGLLQAHLATGGVQGRLSYFLSFTDVELDGYREHSQQGRQRFYGNFNYSINDQTDIHLDVIYANIAEKLPGSLTQATLFSDPRSADPNNVQQEWGRFIDYTRVGGGLRRRFHNRHEISFNLHAQYRNLDHPIFQVLDQDTRSFGGEFRYSYTGERDRFVAGFSPQVTLNGERRFENANGQRGARAALFDTRANNYGFYFENQFDVSPSFTLVAGGRIDWAVRRFSDFFSTNSDQSDQRTFRAFSPKVGFVWRPREQQMQIFANVSRSYEPPLLGELTSFGAPGFLPLKAQDTWQFEAGTRGAAFKRFNYELTFFDLEINDEVINSNVRPFPGAPFTIPSFRSAPNTRHAGVEFALDAPLKRGLFKDGDVITWRSAYTLSRFRYVDDPVYSDNYIPGAPRQILRSELRYDYPAGFWVGPYIDWSPATYFVNSANTARNDKYAILNLRAGFDREQWGIFFEAVNLTDRIYSASVQVDNEAGRFFEPSNGRSAYIGLRYKLGRQ